MKLYNIYTHKHNKNKIMNINEVRSIIRQTIAEAIEDKKKGGLPRSEGKLVHLKKELKSLKMMQEAMGQFNLSEGGDGGFVAEYAHMQKFVNEFNKLKDAHAKLSEMLNNQIGLTEEKIDNETNKIKEMIGLIEKQPVEKKEKKADKGAAKSKHEKGESEKEEEKEHKPKADAKKKAAVKK